MTIITVSRVATSDETAAELDRRGAVIERLETDLRHWREECGKLHSKLNSHATLTATLEEARGALEKIVPTVPGGCALKRELPISALYERKAARDSCYVTIADFDRARTALATINAALERVE